jgi:hypothetical protein
VLVGGGYIGAGCEASSCDVGAGALEGNSSSESSLSKSSSRLTLGFSTAAGVGASSIATSCDSGSGLMASAWERVAEGSSAGVESGVTE